MRRSCLIFLMCMATCLGLALAGVAWAASGGPEPAGYVDGLSGRAEAVHPALGSRVLALEAPVYPEDVVSTGKDSGLRILFRDETTLEMRAESSMTIAAYAYDPENAGLGQLLIKYATGVFRAVTGAIVKENPGHFALEAPLAAVGVRGTEIGSRVAPDSELHALLSGTPIEVSATSGAPQTVARADYGVDVTAGAPIAAPRPLTEEEKRLFAKQAFKRQMDILRRQTLFKTRTMVRPPKMKPHF